MTKGHDPDEPVFREPSALLDHVIEHHRDLRDRPPDIDETEEEKIEKYFAPRWYLIAPLCITLFGRRGDFVSPLHGRCRKL